jgi:hypothetical protein
MTGAHGSPAQRGALRTFAVLAAVTLIAVAAFGWWASHQGYISLFGEDCSDEGFVGTPTYKELVETYGKSPYCARDYLGDTWLP